MSKRKKRRQAPPLPKRSHSTLQRARLWFAVLLTLTAIVVTTVVICLSQSSDATDEKDMRKTEHTSSLSTTVATSQPTSLDELLALPDDDLAQVDLAVMNLLCAEGLPGAENLDVASCSALLDQWAERVRQETDRHLYRFRKRPSEYENSEGYFRILMLNTVLQQDFGVHYNMARMRDVDFRNAKDVFIHGMIGDSNGGTCASMPVLITAVARRLGYPVRLVTTKAHVFCRWDAPNDRINLEVSATGMNTYPDSHYKEWPIPSSETDIKASNFLVSLSPEEELASFLENRAHCLTDHNRPAEAKAAFTLAAKLCPDIRRYVFYAKNEKTPALQKKKTIPSPHSSFDVDRLNRENALLLQAARQTPAPHPTPSRPSAPAHAVSGFKARQQARQEMFRH